MKTLCVIHEGKVINIGSWNALYPLPEGAVEGEFDITETASGCFVLLSDYAAMRRDAYPSITEQLDMQYHDSVDGGCRWATAIAVVKIKYPKSEN